MDNTFKFSLLTFVLIISKTVVCDTQDNSPTKEFVPSHEWQRVNGGTSFFLNKMF